MAYDGTLKFDTSIDNSGFKKGLNKLGGIAKAGLKTVSIAVGAAGSAISAMGGYAIKAGSDFESSMSQVAAREGITVEEIRDGSKEYEIMAKAAKDAGATTQFSATQSAQALNYLALAGYDAVQAAEVLPSVLNLAAAGNMDLAYASDLATDAMSALGIEASNKNLTAFGDKMARTASKANTSVSQLGEAILTVGGTAKSLAGGTTELNAVLGVLANRGTKGAEAGTALRNIILSLSAPTDKAAKALKELGVEVFDAEGNMRPLNEIFKDFNSVLDDMTEGQKTQVLNEIFNKVDLKDVQSLLAGCGDEFDNLTRSIDDSGGAMQNMADTQIDNLQGDITILKSALEGLGIQFYESIQNPLREIAQTGTKYIGRLSDAFSKNGLSGAVDEAGKILGEITVKIAQAAPSIAEAAVSLLISFAESIKSNSGIILDAVLNLVDIIYTTLLSLMPYKLQKPIKETIDGIKSAFSGADFMQTFNSAKNLIDNLVDVALKLAKTALPAVAKIVVTVAKNFKTLLPLLTATIAAWKAYKIISTITTASAKLANAIIATSAATSAEALATAVSTGALTLKQVAVGVLTGKIGLATAAQWLWNAAMSANPIGIVVVAVAALSTALIALNLTMDDSYEGSTALAESMSGINESANKFSDGIRSATGVLDNMNTVISDTEIAQNKLVNELDVLQSQLNELTKNNSIARSEMIDSEKAKYDELLGKIEETNEQISAQQETIAKSSLKKLQSYAKSEHNMTEERAQSYIKSAQETRDEAISIAEQRYSTELEKLRIKFEDEKSITSEEYDGQISQLQTFRDKSIEVTNGMYGDTLAAVNKSYTDRNIANSTWYSDLVKFNNDVEAENTRHSEELANINNANYLNYDLYYTDLDTASQTHASNLDAINKGMAGSFDQSAKEQLGAWLAMVSQADLYGGELTGEQQETVNEILKYFENLPDEAKEEMKETWLGMKDELKNGEPELYEAAEKDADSLINAIDDTLDINSPSKVMMKRGEYVIDGLKRGLDNKRQSLLDKARGIANSIIGVINGAFQIKSPSRVMIKTGLHIDEGLSDGLDKGQHSLVFKAKGIAQRLSAELSGIGSRIRLAVDADMAAAYNRASAKSDSSSVNNNSYDNRQSFNFYTPTATPSEVARAARLAMEVR